MSSIRASLYESYFHEWSKEQALLVLIDCGLIITLIYVMMLKGILLHPALDDLDLVQTFVLHNIRMLTLILGKNYYIYLSAQLNHQLACFTHWTLILASPFNKVGLLLTMIYDKGFSLILIEDLRTCPLDNPFGRWSAKFSFDLT